MAFPVVGHVGYIPTHKKAPKSAVPAEGSVRARREHEPRHLYRVALTERESEILNMMIEECPVNRLIAQRFGISEETVKRHLSNIMDKTGYSTKLESPV